MLEGKRTLWRLFRNEQEEPEAFYSLLAETTSGELENHYGPLAGQRILDLGCGPGFYTHALRRRGARVVPVDNDPAELRLVGAAVEGAMLADARSLPFEDASFDAVFCSNLLEHTPGTARVLEEIERVLRPGGWAYVSWTNWYSPWGGHDMTPYQYLGPLLGPRLYERIHGPPRKNAYGDGLFPVHIGRTLRLVGSRRRLDLEAVEPRYWPRLAWLCRVPILREFVTWNCVLRLRKRTAGANSYLSADTHRTSEVPASPQRQAPPDDPGRLQRRTRLRDRGRSA